VAKPIAGGNSPKGILGETVLSLFSAISAMVGVAAIHRGGVRNQPVAATKPALTRPVPMLYKHQVFTAIPR
jgi:hypothetical protein